MGNGYLERYYDSGLELPKSVTQESLIQGEVDRISNALAIVVYAATIPRRLGGDADDRMLAADMKRTRRVGHALKQSVQGWVKKVPQLDLTDEVRIAGAQLDWKTFEEAHLAEIQVRMRLVSTWSIRHESHRWGKSAIVHLENELNWFTYALRD